MKYLSVTQTAEKWGISQRRIQILCNEERIEGAVRAIPGQSQRTRQSLLTQELKAASISKKTLKMKNDPQTSQRLQL